MKCRICKQNETDSTSGLCEECAYITYIVPTVKSPLTIRKNMLKKKKQTKCDSPKQGKWEEDKRFFNLLADKLEELFPKGKCKERSQALVLNAFANIFHDQLLEAQKHDHEILVNTIIDTKNEIIKRLKAI